MEIKRTNKTVTHLLLDLRNMIESIPICRT